MILNSFHWMKLPHNKWHAFEGFALICFDLYECFEIYIYLHEAIAAVKGMSVFPLSPDVFYGT